MNLPFNKEQFLEIFAEYNVSVFPAQIAFFALAILVLALSAIKSKYSGKTISSVLAFFWLWMGIVYHIIFFTGINKAAYLFGALFILQGLILIYHGVYKSALTFNWRHGIAGLAAGILITYSLIIYPLLGVLFGHVYPNSPTFGLPCPTTIFTLGVLLTCEGKYLVSLFIIPMIWSLIGFFAAVKFGVFEDIGLLAAGLITLILIFYFSKQNKSVLS